MNTFTENAPRSGEPDKYVTLDDLATQAGLSVPSLKEKLLQLNLLDAQEVPVGEVLQTPATQYRFFEEEGHLEGEWLLHRDLLDRLQEP